MDINDLNFFKAITAKLHWLDARQRVLADNVANADTPNYQAKDLPPISFREHLERGEAGATLNMTRTAGNHLTGAPINGGGMQQAYRPVAEKTETTPTNNNVVLEEELIKVTETAANYNIMLRLYKKGEQMMKLAVQAPK